AVAAAALWGSATVFGRYALAGVGFTTLTALRFTFGLPALAVVLPLIGGLGAFGQYRAADVPIYFELALVPGLIGLLLLYRRLASRRGQLEDRYPPGRLVGIVEDLGGAQYRPDHPGSERYAADVGSEDVFEEPGRLFRGQLRCLDGILVSVSGDPPRARDP